MTHKNQEKCFLNTWFFYLLMTQGLSAVLILLLIVIIHIIGFFLFEPCTFINFMLFKILL